MIPRGRGRGNSPSNRGGRGRAIITHGKGQLFNAAISQGAIQGTSTQNSGSSQFASQFPLLQGNDQLYQQFMQFMQQQGVVKSQYKDAIIQEEDNEISSDNFIKNPYRETILTIEYQDVMTHLESRNTPWEILSKYLDNQSYTVTVYKSRNYYEKLLLDTSTCEIKHTTKEDHKNNSKFHIYSKMIIRKILTAEDWGLSPFREKQFMNPENNSIVKYNYWDYVDALHKVFYYQNPGKKHSWFIKIISTVYNPKLPNWFFNWWKSYGPSIQILQEPFKDYYVEWTNLCPKLFDTITHKADSVKEIIPSLLFFIEFSIPWIWRWEPEIEYGDQELPQLKRAFFTKFWVNMLKKDETTGEINSKDTIEFIQSTLIKYKDQQQIQQKDKMKELAPLNPIQIIEAQLIAKGIKDPTQDQIMEAYMVQIQKDVMKFTQEKSKSDTSMESFSGGENSFQCLAGESQDPNEDDLEIPDFFEILKTQILKNKPSLIKMEADKIEQENKDKGKEKQ